MEKKQKNKSKVSQRTQNSSGRKMPYNYWDMPGSQTELKELAERAINGSYTMVDNFISRLLDENLEEADVFDKMKLNFTNQELVNVVSESFPYIKFKDLIRPLNMVLTKDERLSSEFCTRGDDYLQSNYTVKALHCYTIALKFIPPDSTNVSRLYMQRFEIFKSNEEYKLAIKELDRAMAVSTIPFKFRGEFMLKKKEVEKLAAGKVESEEYLPHQMLREKILSNAVKIGADPSKISVPNFIEVSHSSKRGRFLTARQRINPGNPLFMETAYVHVTVNQLLWQDSVCDRCLRKTRNPIPCENCVFFSYCSEKCRLEDKGEGHCYECPILAFLHTMRMSRNSHLAIKAVCKAGPEVLYGLFLKSKDPQRAANFWVVPPDEIHGKLDAYTRVLNTASHNTFSRATAVATWLSIAMASALRLYSPFFERIQENMISEFENFVASIILHHFKSFGYNTCSIGHISVHAPLLDDFLERYETESDFETHIGSGIYPIFNLMNHSCAPSTFRVHLPGAKLYILANRGIEVGGELSHSYGPIFANEDIQERNTVLKTNFDFECDCLACIYKWPTMEEMVDIPNWSHEVYFYCPGCKKLPKIANEQRPTLKYLTRSWGKCENCGEYFSTTGLWDRFVALCNLQAKGNNLLRKNEPIDGFKYLIASIDGFERLTAEPCFKYLCAQTVLIDSLDLFLQGKMGSDDPTRDPTLVVKLESEKMQMSDIPEDPDVQVKEQKFRCIVT